MPLPAHWKDGCVSWMLSSAAACVTAVQHTALVLCFLNSHLCLVCLSPTGAELDDAGWVRFFFFSPQHVNICTSHKSF